MQTSTPVRAGLSRAITVLAVGTALLAGCGGGGGGGGSTPPPPPPPPGPSALAVTAAAQPAQSANHQLLRATSDSAANVTTARSTQFLLTRGELTP